MGNQTEELDSIDINTSFFMDVLFGSPSPINEVYTNVSYVNMLLEFSIVLENAYIEGAGSASYNLTVNSSNGNPVNEKFGYYDYG